MKLGSNLIATFTLLACMLMPFAGAAASVQLSAVGVSSLSMAGQSQKNDTNKLKVSSAQQAIKLVKRQYQGKILKVQSSRVNGHPGYKVKLLSNEGVVFYVSVDAQTASVHRN